MASLHRAETSGWADRLLTLLVISIWIDDHSVDDDDNYDDYVDDDETDDYDNNQHKH